MAPHVTFRLTTEILDKTFKILGTRFEGKKIIRDQIQKK